MSTEWTEEDRTIIPPHIYFGHADAYFGNFFFGQGIGDDGYTEETKPTTTWTEESR